MVRCPFGSEAIGIGKMKTFTPHRLLFLAGLAVLALISTASAQVVFSGTGTSAGDPALLGAVNGFRTALGTLNPNVAGSFGSGRREINWDGVPDALSAPNNMPANFFNVNSPRGVVFSTPGSSFQVSGNAGVAPVRFDNINATYSSTFQAFSQQRLFTPVGSNLMDVTFFVPGTTSPALTNGFGSIFADIDLTNTTSLAFFDASNNLLGTFFAQAQNNGLSFLGVLFNSAIVSRVRITTGNVPLGPNDGGGIDVVVMDDFIYGEPIPEGGATVALLGLALGVLAVMRARVTALPLRRGRV